MTLYPYARIHRVGTPVIQGFYILHEGLIGYVGEAGLQELAYADMLKAGGGKTIEKANGGWLGFTDKYWAAALVPTQGDVYTANFRGTQGSRRHQGELPDRLHAEPAGDRPRAEEVRRGPPVRRRQEGAADPGLRRRSQDQALRPDDRLGLVLLHHQAAVLADPARLSRHAARQLRPRHPRRRPCSSRPRSSRSPTSRYESMAKMKKLQPEMEQLRERYKDDKVEQQQELMELYKKQKINPMAGCLPMLLQIPVFFALYKVLFVTIDMRHAPFFGWIKDLSAPDPTSLFNLFGLLPFAVPEFLHIGVWPLIMGVTMWVQMQLNPKQPDPIAADDLQLDAGDVHLHAGVVPGRPRDLLGLEQPAVDRPAVADHEEAGRRDPAVEEHRPRQAVRRGRQPRRSGGTSSDATDKRRQRSRPTDKPKA